MVQLAAKPRGVLLDPCCGTGTILGEALAAGWAAGGTDIDEAAIAAASRTAPAAAGQLGDARVLLRPDARGGASVSELPSPPHPHAQRCLGLARWVLSRLSRVA